MFEKVSYNISTVRFKRSYYISGDWKHNCLKQYSTQEHPNHKKNKNTNLIWLWDVEILYSVTAEGMKQCFDRLNATVDSLM